MQGTMTKRSIDPQSTPAKRRVQPTTIEKRPFQIINLTDGELVHQACVAIHGECQIFDYAEETNFVSVSTTDSFNQAQPAHHWPLHKGQWKALVMLAPGNNKISFKLHHVGGIHDSFEISVNYVPLLQLPPLHLAILVAKDSPLLIDCPPAKYGGISTAHSTLDAAVAKFRMSAYMWQAATAEDFRQKGLGRRSFRLDEEWTSNTTMRTVHQVTPGDFAPMNAVAKVHVIRSDKSVAEIRDAQVAQQNPRGGDRDALHRYFETALLNSGVPAFQSNFRPVVAGMVLDAHYSIEQSMILGHAALGCHKAEGISLGIFGSHLTYSWPRFLEEVPACLADMTLTGDTVGNDNGECDTMRGACFVGQGAFLHEVGHAFGAGHTTGIMARGYSKSWAMNFIDHQTNDKLVNEAKWDLRDVLQFKLLPHFSLPGDEPVSSEFKNATVSIEFDIDIDDDDVLKVSCKAGLARVNIQNGNNDPKVLLADSDYKVGYCTTEVRIHTAIEELDRSQPLKVTALGVNGKERVIKDAWAILKEKPYISIPSSKVVLRKQSVHSDQFGADDGEDDETYVPWAMLLHHRGKDGHLHRATSIDLRVGCTMDGAVVYYADGEHQNCGPARNFHNNRPHTFGGHASERHELPAGETITKVLICKQDDHGWGSLSGIRMVLSNGETWGYLNNDRDNETEGNHQTDSVVTLEPEEDEVIVGFYGQSDSRSGFTYQFGILTAPKGVELPDVIYDMPELSNA